ncbi:MAG TPA: MbcA/ParS/Xre antitoxin family protein, partial [Steroidobacteraceae bacterium]|nr:MbcA/ParS/Xre antitoxin family protein [Steroidobacteraceae bacterium]
FAALLGLVWVELCYWRTGVTVANSSTQDSDREILAKAIRRLFELWNLSDAQSAGVLGLENHQDPILTQIRSGGSLPNETGLVARARILLSIHRKLQLLLPTNPQVAMKWIHAPNPQLNGSTPIEIIRTHGDLGAQQIASLLERQSTR